MNVALLRVLPADRSPERRCRSPTRPRSCSAHGARRLIDALAIWSPLPLISATLLCVPRMLYAMGDDGLIPAALGVVDRRGTPVAALLCSTVMAPGLLSRSARSSRSPPCRAFFAVISYAERASSRCWCCAVANPTCRVRSGRGAIRGRCSLVDCRLPGESAAASSPARRATPRSRSARSRRADAVYRVRSCGLQTRRRDIGLMIRSVAVLGAGVMGAQIAAHFANAGVPALLLDVTAEAAAAGAQAARGAEARSVLHARHAGRSSRPAASTTACRGSARPTGSSKRSSSSSTSSARCSRGSTPRGGRVDRQLEHVRHSRSRALAEGRSDDFRRHWLGTHFFNPPRYLQLLEIIPTPDTSRRCVDAVRAFADHRLGKGVVVAKDSPNFIGNHLALYGVMRILEQVAAGDVHDRRGRRDHRSGARPAEERHVPHARSRRRRHPRPRRPQPARAAGDGARAAFVLPPFVERCSSAGSTGEKAGQGFYKRVKGADGESRDPDARSGDARVPPAAAAEAARRSTPRRTDHRHRRAGADAVQRQGQGRPVPARHAGADARLHGAGHADDRPLARRRRPGDAVGLRLGARPFELHGRRSALGNRRGLATAARSPPAATRPRSCSGARAVTVGASSRRTPGASLVDLGDGVLCVEFHSKMNAIGGDTIQMLQAGVREASRNFAALVVGNEALHFSAGANLMLVLLEAQEENWDEIDLMVRAFQQATMALRYADVPVVVAPAGLALGGGCEIALHGDRVQAAAETYIGLVEVGVGLIPAGGGTKEMMARAAEQMPPGGADLLPPIQRAFETIAFAKTSTSGPDARRLGYLRPVGRHHDEPRAAHRRREGAGAAARRRGLPAAGAAPGDPGRRRRGAGAAEARRAPGLARRPHQRPRRADRPQAGDDHGRRRRCRIPRPSASSTCSTSSARRS